jgi:hypothetical protein
MLLGGGFSTVGRSSGPGVTVLTTIVEGGITMLVAVIAIPILPDFPQTTKWGFTKQELQVAQLRMLEDVSHCRRDGSTELTR